MNIAAERLEAAVDGAAQATVVHNYIQRHNGRGINGASVVFNASSSTSRGGPFKAFKEAIQLDR